MRSSNANVCSIQGGEFDAPHTPPVRRPEPVNAALVNRFRDLAGDSARRFMNGCLLQRDLAHQRAGGVVGFAGDTKRRGIEFDAGEAEAAGRRKDRECQAQAHCPQKAHEDRRVKDSAPYASVPPCSVTAYAWQWATTSR